jgi:hypothetical protein
MNIQELTKQSGEMLGFNYDLLYTFRYGTFLPEKVIRLLNEHHSICSLIMPLLHPSRLKYEDIPVQIYQLQQVTWQFIEALYPDHKKERPMKTGILISVNPLERIKLKILFKSMGVDKVERINKDCLLLWWA